MLERFGDIAEKPLQDWIEHSETYDDDDEDELGSKENTTVTMATNQSANILRAASNIERPQLLPRG